MRKLKKVVVAFCLLLAVGLAGCGEAQEMSSAVLPEVFGALQPEDFHAYDGSGELWREQPGLGSFAFSMQGGLQTLRGIKIGDSVADVLEAYGDLLCRFNYLPAGESAYVFTQGVPFAETWEKAGQPDDFRMIVQLYVSEFDPRVTYTYENIDDFEKYRPTEWGFDLVEGYRLYNLDIEVIDGMVKDIGTYMEMGG